MVRVVQLATLRLSRNASTAEDRRAPVLKEPSGRGEDSKSLVLTVVVGPEGLEPPTPELKVRILISRPVLLPAAEARSVRDFGFSFPTMTAFFFAVPPRPFAVRLLCWIPGNI